MAWRYTRRRRGTAGAAACGAAFLLVALAVPSRAATEQCTLGAPVQFTPRGSPIGFGESGFADSLALFETASGKRVVVRENYGYSVFALGNPAAPSFVGAQDLTVSPGYEVTADGFETTTVVTAAPDGSRILLGYKDGTPSSHSVLLMRPAGELFTFGGEFLPTRASAVAVDQVGSRYIGYSTNGSAFYVADVSAFSSGSCLALPCLPVRQLGVPPNGRGLQRANLAGGSINDHFLAFATNQEAIVIDGSSPGPPTWVTDGILAHAVPVSAFGFAGTAALSRVAVGVHPATAKLYLAGFGTGAGTVLGLAALASTDGGVTFGPLGTGQPLVPPGSFSSTPQALTFVATSDDLFLVAFSGGSGGVKLTTVSMNGWDRAGGTAVDLSPGAVIPPSTPSFMGASEVSAFARGSSLHAYVGAHFGSFALQLACGGLETRAVATLAVQPVPCPGGGSSCPLAENATVFVGDTLAVAPAVASAQALTDWRFDHDFHAGAPDDAGLLAPLRLQRPDLSLAGTGTAPPPLVTVVGPCDPRGGGTPATGAGCWPSVTGNSGETGTSQPDFPPGATSRSLTIAFEASNADGSAGPAFFPLTWRLPAVRLTASTILLGEPLSALGSQGHPLDATTGYRWYFGADPGAPSGEPLVLDPLCTGATCTHSFPVAGLYNHWVSVPYPGGYVTPDCPGAPGACTSSLGAVSVTDAVVTATAPATAPLASPTFPVSVSVRRSALVTDCTPAFEVALCDPAGPGCVAGTALVWSPLTVSAGAAAVPIPAAQVGQSFWLRIRYRYTTVPGGCGTSGERVQPWRPALSGVSDPTAWPIQFTATQGVALSVSLDSGPAAPSTGEAVTFTANASGGTPPHVYLWSFGDGASGSGNQASHTCATPGSRAVTCTVSDAAGKSVQGITWVSVDSPGCGSGGDGSLATTILATPPVQQAGVAVTFSGSAAGGVGTPTFAWCFGDGGTASGANAGHTFATPGSYRVGLDAADGAGKTGHAALLVSVTAAAPAGPGFYPVAPCRVVDTRGPDGPFGGGAIPAGGTRTFALALARCGIPGTAKAVSVNLTVVNPAAPGSLVLFPAGVSVPSTSSLSFAAGKTRANNAIVKLGSSGTGTVEVTSSAAFPVDVVLDLDGYFD